jgi:hypothetical protein
VTAHALRANQTPPALAPPSNNDTNPDIAVRP